MTVWNLNLDDTALTRRFQIPALCTPRSLKGARQTSERKMTDREPSEALNIWVSKGKYDLATRAGRAVVGRNKQQLDKGTGGKKWKCHDPLNCVASAAF